jgi:Tol biopolymer transport system component
MRLPQPLGISLSIAAVLGGCSDPAGPGDGPTGNRIAFLADGNVSSMREDGSNRVRLTRDTIGSFDGASGLTWSPDGTSLLVHLTRQGPGGIADEAVVVPADGSAYRVAASVLEWGLQIGSWSPDSRRIAYVKATTSHFGSTSIYTATPEGADERELVTGTPEYPPGAHDLNPSWSPSGSEIAFVSDRTVPGAPEFETHLFVAVEGTSGARQVSTALVTTLNWAPDGSRFATTQGNGVPFGDHFFSNIYLTDRQSGASTRLSEQDNVDTGPLWSPDGSRLAFTSIRDGNIEVYVMNSDGSAVGRLTHDPAEDWVGAWSPDGNRLTIQTNRDGNWEIYSINVDGTGLANLTRSPGQETNPVWR